MRRSFFLLTLLLLDLVLLPACNQTIEAKDSPNRDDCLFFYSQVSGSEGIYQKCPENERTLIVSIKNLIDYAFDGKTHSIIYSFLDKDNNVNIAQSDLGAASHKILYPCGSHVCDNVLVSPAENVISFTIMDEKPRIVLFNSIQNFETVIEYGNVTFADISPDGKYLRYFVQDSSVLRIFDLEDLRLLAFWQTNSDLIGGWSLDSRAFLLGGRDVDQQLRRNILKEITVAENTEETLFELPADFDISQTLYKTENIFFALAHVGVKTNTRQVVEIDRNGAVFRQITDDPVFNHSSFSWNEKTQQLVYQRYDVTSSRSVPQIWIWDQAKDVSTLIAENATLPIWLSD